MTAGRDFAAFVLPFAAGIMAASISGLSSYAASEASLLIASSSIFLLCHPSRSSLNSASVLSLIITSSIAAGCLVGFTHNHWSISLTAGDFRISDLGMKVKSCIDDIPFKDSQTNNIISALITGERSGISPEVKSAFRRSGASHILALSGLHLGIIYGLLSVILSLLGKNPFARSCRSLLTITSCALYTYATGAGPSITRAFLFVLIGETARLTGRSTDISDTLMAALFIQLLLSPASAAEPGFQLSYAAMAGIAYIFPSLKGFWPEGKGGIMRWVWNSAALSIACQITTGPLAYLYFGTFPKYFILTNMLALPLVGIIIPTSILTLLLNYMGICPDILIKATELLVSCMTGILGTIALL